MAADCLVKIYATVEIGSAAEPFVECHADDVAVFVVGAPAVNRQQCAAINLEAELAHMRDIEGTYAVDEVVCSGHVAPGAELVDLDTDRMDDVVDAVLHDDAPGACDIHFDGEAGSSLETVGCVGDATVFAENACAANRAADDGDIVEPFACTTQREVIRPVLRRDGIAETHQREVLFFGENVDGVEKINPVRFAREIVGERGRFREIAVAVLAARKRPRDSRTRVHLCEICEVEADIERFACDNIECDFVAQDFFTRGDCSGSAAAERDGNRRVCNAARCIGGMLRGLLTSC